MNAKFEKWCHHERDLGHFIDMAKCGDGSYLSVRTFELNDVWNAATKAALQSLEVTPSLIELAWAELDAALNGTNDGTEYAYGDATPMHVALTAVFNALKEQAK